MSPKDVARSYLIKKQCLVLQDNNELVDFISGNYFGTFVSASVDDYGNLDIKYSTKSGEYLIMEIDRDKLRSECEYCRGTGQHYSPDAAEPILIDCSSKKCTVGK